ncbi:hypothetical protein M407DRAFT_199247 [Tulasnella calospora MUT 4182]|uniref:Uncharacterized protein n=1 Tax=Tulasnella calospora MUT 4182 TaxID=1051891 RepID=A0A0C3QL46_9AGAM|nr:hypothetical protein M407DRAFT_199247 [Tulasnella calospora MUT 4182]
MENPWSADKGSELSPLTELFASKIKCLWRHVFSCTHPEIIKVLSRVECGDLLDAHPMPPSCKTVQPPVSMNHSAPLNRPR